MFNFASAMLSLLRIKNFAIIKEAEITFENGLNVITGETGAGKSILLSALRFLLGERFKEHYLRDGGRELIVEGAFNPSTEVLVRLPEQARAEQIIISRSMNINGKGKIMINGHLATQTMLSEVAAELIDICAQGQQVKLLDAGYHLLLLDAFGAHQDVSREYALAFKEYEKFRKMLEQAEVAAQNFAKREIELSAILEDFNEIIPEQGLKERLETIIWQAQNSEKEESLIAEARALLGESGAIEDLLLKLSQKLLELSKTDPEKYGSLNDKIDLLRKEAAELDKVLSKFSYAVEFDGNQIEEARSKLSLIARLERKYRVNEDGLISIYQDARSELEGLNLVSDPQKIKLSLRIAEENLRRCGERLSKSRQTAAERLVSAVNADFKDLAMLNARLKVEFSEAPFSINGGEKAEFFFSANKGESLRPLKQIASGGELSRLTLALKKNLGANQAVNIMVFDEIDVGMSGAAARAVGEKLKELSNFSQVICITHLPQVASLADHHFLVSKFLEEDRTTSRIAKLTKEERINEIARMLAGFNITKTAKETARELLNSP
ncbi:MAG TPA: DNA repair protein RecN [Oligoflexia bacterium]|nr:DNA repair protein RecN [Oligoflexia bacterium]HMP26367.1 DNA repair protein RecN [Oligoflexia bacterium]